MTGTAMTEANEFWKIYKLDVIAIPTNKPLIRLNHADVIFRSEKEKWEALVGEIVEVHRAGRPMLIGTTDVEKSEKLSALLKRRGVKHELLNAKPEFAAREAEIVAQAGRIGGVTIATNMAGRGTDIILGGNPETLAWARLKDKYPTRLDVPEDEWKRTVEEIEKREDMKAEGRKVAEMGGLHIIGTERHEARRIDNQLRGRAGRQGDPGSSRFYLSLQDDLMRIFAGEWVAGVLTRLGMEEGQAIESRMVSRRIEGAQKKVEERNFDIRKNLLEYDEVMDHQRKRVYGFRQEVLDGANCKVRILEMLDEQVTMAVDRFLDDDYGPSSFAEFAANRLGVEFDAADFNRSTFAEAEKAARDKAGRLIPTQIQEAMDENLSEDVDAKEWNWQAMANTVNTRWGLKTTDRQLKQVGRDNLAQHLIEQAEKAVAAVDLKPGEPYLSADWGYRSIIDWARIKFQIKLAAGSLDGKEADDIKALLHEQVMEIYRQKEIEFPVRVGMARFMADRPQQPGGGQRYDREGLYRWAKQRFGGLVGSSVPAVHSAGGGPGDARPSVPDNGAKSADDVQMTEEEFRTLSRPRLQEKLLELSRQYFPKVRQQEIDAHLEEAYHGTRLSEPEDARELADWFREEVGLDVPEAALTGVTQEAARQVLWNAFDERYRPEMRRMERSLLLGQLDTSWKNHLYTMDHLRSGIGLVSYAQVDPKTEYKRQGMKEFDAMWEGVQDKVTDTVFRMEEEEGFQESVWAIGATIHESARAMSAADERSIRGQQDAAIAGSQKGAAKPEPIRNRGERVGRNEPCPCGSGKKYKNCHMRQAAG
jgi:preprotein translocase subunit SecA